MPAYQFYYVGVDGLCVTLYGLQFDYNLGVSSFVSPVGLMTHGLIYGDGDYWQYDDNVQTITWSNDVNVQNITWTAVNP